jgi:hypothetical protein
MAKSQVFAFGWCTAGNHQHCRGALRRPQETPEENLVYCACPCHDGQDVTPPEVLQPKVNEYQERKLWFENTWSDLIVYQDIEIETTEDEYKSVSAKLRSMAVDANVVIKTRFSDGKLRVRVV